MSRVDDLTPGQARFVLDQILKDKKIRSRDIDKYLKEMDREIESLEERLSMLRQTPASGASASTRATRARKPRKGGKKGAKRGSRKATTPEAQRSRQLQGQYISLIKRFSGKQRDKFKNLAKKQGREEAVKQMKAAIGT